MKNNKSTNITKTPSLEEQNQLLNILNQGLFAEAITKANAMITSYPNHSLAWKVLGAALQSLGRTDESLIAKKTTVELAPNDMEALCNLCNTLMIQRNFNEAEKYYRAALEINPEELKAIINLGILLTNQKRFLEAVNVYKNALQQLPDNFLLMVEWLFARRKICEWHDIEKECEKLLSHFEKDPKTVVPFMLLSISNFEPKHLKQVGNLFATACYKDEFKSSLHTKRIFPRQKLRIGYLSADFHDHATVLLMAGVLENRNKDSFDVYLYSYGVEKKSLLRSRIENSCDIFRNVRELSNMAIAKQIVTDEIDILVDLKGYTQNCRIEIQALRPAPILVSWLGYPGTLGHERLADYIIGDATVTPLEHADHYSEKLALMPYCYQPNDNKRPIGVTPTRTEIGLSENTFVFCTFNQAYKITPDMFDIWCRLLDAVTNSVLWLLEPHPAAQENLRHEMASRGIESSRLIFAAKMDQTAHLGRLQLADLAVDTFPYTSHTTASDALWAGVPLVTKMGETFASRVAASILKAMDLDELVTTNDDDYFHVALELAQNPEKLAAIKAKIQIQKQTSPLFDTQKFARDLERLYQTIWEKELRGERKAVVLTNEPQEVTTNETLAKILRLERLTEIVDIGANPINGDPPYKPMLVKSLCHVTGFEPQESALAELLKKKSNFERYLPYAVGDSNLHTLNICHASGMTSLFEPDATTLELFDVLKPLAEVTQRIELQTRRLDEIVEIEKLDFLKIDIQGGELLVFQNGIHKLTNAVAIQVEVSFVTLYKNQPTIGEIDSELRCQGFVPHCFAAVKNCVISPCVLNNDPDQPLNQLLEADIVYVRDFSKPEFMTDEQLKHLAMIVHYCYGSFDLALRCIMLLEQRNALPSGSQQTYLDFLQTQNTK